MNQGPSRVKINQNVSRMYVDYIKEYQSDKMAALFTKIFLAPKSSWHNKYIFDRTICQNFLTEASIYSPKAR